MQRPLPSIEPEPSRGGQRLAVISGEPHHGVRSGERIAQQRADHLAERGQGLLDTGRIGPARMHRLEHHGRRIGPGRPHLIERDLRAFGDRVLPPEAMVITRPGRPVSVAVSANRSNSNEVNRNGPTTWLAIVISVPCGDSRRSEVSAPALCTSASSRGYCSSSWSAAARTESRSPMSAITACTESLPVEHRISPTTPSVLVAFRPTITTVAPHRAHWPAAARPSPEVPPVTTITRDARSYEPSSVQWNKRRRASNPSRVKLGAIGSSRAASSAAGRFIGAR